MPIDAVFNANDFAPKQGGGGHPVGNKFPFRITNTTVKPSKDGSSGMFEVELSSDVGSIKHNYNLWNASETARRISGEQLSALCHAVGIFQVDFKNDGAALRGGVGLMDIGFQKGHEPSQEKPEGGYVELKKVYDKNGNEPGKPAIANNQQSNLASSGFVQAAQQVSQGAVTNAAGPAVQQGWGQSTNQQPLQQGAGWGDNAGGGIPSSPPWGGAK